MTIHPDTTAGVLNPRLAFVQDDAGQWHRVTQAFAYRAKVASRYEWAYTLHTASGIVRLAEHELETRTRSAEPNDGSARQAA